MFNIIIGRSGSGKTERIFNDIEKNVLNKKRTYLLVPEQQLYLSESMLAKLPASSALYVEIVSFARLCGLVAAKCGGLTGRSVGGGTRNLIMWQTLREISQSSEDFKSMRADPVLAAKMLSTLDELRSNSIDSTYCEEIASSVQNSQLAKKLSYIAAVYSGYEDNLKDALGSSAVAAEGKLAALAEILSVEDFFSESDVFIDSFTSFTGEEYEIIKLILKQADNVTVALTHYKDQTPEGSDEFEEDMSAPHLKSIAKTVLKLKSFDKKAKIKVLGEYTRSSKKELSLLEKYLWDFKNTTNKPLEIDPRDCGAIEMHKCANEYEEIWFAALNVIKEKARNVDYSDIAIIMRNPESRKGIIEAVFEELGIPYFLSERTDLSTTAPARLILSALRCIAYNFNSVDVMTLLKTGLLNVDDRDADLFEDYCYTWNISGKKFTEDAIWSMNPDGYSKDRSKRANDILERANRVRQILIPPLVNLRTQLAISGGDTEQNCRALYAYLEEIKLSENLAGQAEKFLEQSTPNIKAAGETLRIYDYIISAIADVSVAFKNVKTNADDLATAMDIMLKNTDIGSVPAMIDYVTIGSAATLRVENIKTAIVLGLCEGEFPSNYADNGILNEQDKAELDKVKLSLSSREDIIISEELFYVYRAMTKPSEKLILSSYKTSLSGGKPAIPSSAWNRVLSLFPHLATVVTYDDKGKEERTVREFDFKAFKALYNKNESQNPKISADTDKNTEFKISSDCIDSVLGNELNLSKSAINLIAQCPYKYWAQNVLHLRDRKIGSVSYDSAGTIVHYILEKTISELKTKDGRLPKFSSDNTVKKDMDGKLTEITDETLIRYTDKYLLEYISGINCPLPPSAMYGFSRMRNLALVMLRDVFKEFEKSQFRILALEKNIKKDRAGALKPIAIKVYEDREDSPLAYLTGQIDRIDIYRGENNDYVRVVDYKTGSHAFNAKKIETGDDLQLPAYLFTAVLDENKGFFSLPKEGLSVQGDSSNGGEVTQKKLLPAGAEFLYTEDKEGTVTPITSGFILNDTELIDATGYVKTPKKGTAPSTEPKDVKKISRAALPEDEFNLLNSVLREAVSETARKLYCGTIEKTPSEDACNYCSYKSFCSVAEKSKRKGRKSSGI